MTNAAVASSDQIQALIVAYIQQELADADSRDVDVDENLFAGGLVDSVGFMRLIAHLSDAVGVTVPAEDLVPENFRTVRVMARYVAGLLA